jgi:hypothetical protein
MSSQGRVSRCTKIDGKLVSSWAGQRNVLGQEGQAKLDVLGLGGESLAFYSSTHSRAHETSSKQMFAELDRLGSMLWTLHD